MSLTVSDPIPVTTESGKCQNLRVISSAEEDRVVLFVRVGGMPASITLDLAAARSLRAALPKPAPAPQP